MKIALIVIAVLVVVGGGYFIYDLFFTYEPASYPVSSLAQASGTPAAQRASSGSAETESAATGGKYARWMGDWQPAMGEGAADFGGFYLHVELAANGLPVFTVRMQKIEDNPFPNLYPEQPEKMPAFTALEAVDDSTVRCRPVMPEGAAAMPQMEILFSLNTAGDRLEMLTKLEQMEQKVAFGKVTGVAELPHAGLPEGMIRAGVARAKADMRSVATALEAFYIDNNRYPQPGATYRVSPSLTTPIAYLSRFMVDPFSRELGDTYNYYDWRGKPQGWVLLSGGPDADIDLTPETFSSKVGEAGFQDAVNLLTGQYGYDPSNGTMSNGDVLRFHQ